MTANASPPASTTAARRNGFADIWRDHPFIMLVTTAAALAVGATVVTLFLTLAADDEPPIRVKTGSLELYLVSHEKHFQQDGSSQNWKISGGSRREDALQVVIAYAGATCSSGVATATQKLVITYSDDKAVTLQSISKKMKIHSDVDLTPDDPANARVLTYAPTPTAGFIKSIAIDNRPAQCTFASANDLIYLAILDQ